MLDFGWLPQVKHGAILRDYQDRNGVNWYHAPIPPVVHLCRPQSRGWIGFHCVERCACGSMRTTMFRRWSGYNSRRRYRLFK
jgi:hypothetical protein